MRPDLLDKTIEVISRLNDEDVEYVVIGGVAMNFHGLVRATEDLDVFVRAAASNIAALRRGLRRVWDLPEIEQITAEDLGGDYPAVRYGPPDDSLPLDILARIGELASYDDLEHEIVEIEGVQERVATPRTLHRLKAGTVRPQDHADAAALRAVFGDEIAEPQR